MFNNLGTHPATVSIPSETGMLHMVDKEFPRCAVSAILWLPGWPMHVFSMRTLCDCLFNTVVYTASIVVCMEQGCWAIAQRFNVITVCYSVSA